MPSIEEAVANKYHVREPDLAQQQEQQHRDFLRQFPRSRWRDLTLDDYALGTESSIDGYSYALEWGTTVLGSIKGGSALKHVIYFKRKTSEWHFPADFDRVGDAWDALHASFLEMLDMADHGRWNDIGQIPILNRAKTVRLKTLFLYFPDQVLPVYSHNHLSYFARELGIEGDTDPLVVNRRILAELRTIEGLESSDTRDLGQFLYEWATPPGWIAARYWKIAPGHNADRWAECLEGGYICVGWDEIGDLSLFDSVEDFRHAFAETYSDHYNGNKSKLTLKARELYQLTEIRAGDKIVANKGVSEVLAVGTVLDSTYQWQPDRPDYRHTIAVDWDESLATRLDPPERSWGTVTIKSVTPKLQSRILNPVAHDPSDEEVEVLPIDPAQEALYRTWMSVLERKKQIIFYGPPGTGKTRAAKGFSQWILNQQFALPDADSDDWMEATYDTSKAWWVTANPERYSWKSMFDDGWVDFSRGEKKKHFSQINTGDVVVCYEAAPTQRIVALARVVSINDDLEDPNPLMLKPIRRLPRGPHWKTIKSDSVLADSEPVQISASGTLFALDPGQFRRILELSGVSDEYLDQPADDIAPYLTQVTFHASYSYEEFIEGYRPVETSGGLALGLRDGIVKRIAATAVAEPDSVYVLLIDEINRANIPRVFGELMTVIEADKRGIPVKLPASGDLLRIPKNLHLIGTMNTADRSIRNLDSALRRRFGFIELLPDVSVLEGAVIDGLELDFFLSEMNTRITNSVGREHQIGQSYFLLDSEPITTAAQFAEIMRMEIIPLLQEIVFDDYSKLADYLGREIVDAANQSLISIEDDGILISALIKAYRVELGDNR